MSLQPCRPAGMIMRSQLTCVPGKRAFAWLDVELNALHSCFYKDLGMPHISGVVSAGLADCLALVGPVRMLAWSLKHEGSAGI